MAFVRKKRIGGFDYHYLVEGRREGGKVHQVVLAYLGHEETVEEAWYMAEREIEDTTNYLGYLEGLPAGRYFLPSHEANRAGLRRKLRRLAARVETYRRYADGPRIPEAGARFQRQMAAISAAREAPRDTPGPDGS
jgi:hypothetical protein